MLLWVLLLTLSSVCVCVTTVDSQQRRYLSANSAMRMRRILNTNHTHLTLVLLGLLLRCCNQPKQSLLSSRYQFSWTLQVNIPHRLYKSQVFCNHSPSNTSMIAFKNFVETTNKQNHIYNLFQNVYRFLV